MRTISELEQDVRKLEVARQVAIDKLTALGISIDDTEDADAVEQAIARAEKKLATEIASVEKRLLAASQEADDAVAELEQALTALKVL